MASLSKIPYHLRLFFWLLTYSWLLVGGLAIFQYYRERQIKAEKINAQLQMVNNRILDDMSINGKEITFNEKEVSYPFKNIRISIIDTDGSVLMDNSLNKLPQTNHLDREEIAEAISNGSGFTLHRHSESTGDTYFYSATRRGDYIVRTAVPYSVSFHELLQADYGFIWVMIGVTLIVCIVGFFVTRRVGVNISRLNKFARSAELGESIYDTTPFPNDELGSISNHIVRLYARLQQAISDRDREYKRALQQQQEKERIKKQLTNNINHELKTPVAAMMVCVETLLLHPDLPLDKREEFLQRCAINGHRLQRLLEDVSMITRMDDGKQAIVTAPINIGNLVSEVCDDFRQLASEHNMTINNPKDTYIVINGSSELLISVFHNLIANAISYSGGSRIDIDIWQASSEHVIVTVADNGCGVAPEHLPRLFERFYRVDKGRSRQIGGTGLGLSIVKNAVLLHGGSVTVENLEGGGLKFSIVLSLYKSEMD